MHLHVNNVNLFRVGSPGDISQSWTCCCKRVSASEHAVSLRSAATSAPRPDKSGIAIDFHTTYVGLTGGVLKSFDTRHFYSRSETYGGSS